MGSSSSGSGSLERDILNSIEAAKTLETLNEEETYSHPPHRRQPGHKPVNHSPARRLPGRPAYASTAASAAPDAQSDRQGIPSVPDVEDYSLNYLKYRKFLEAPLARCLDDAPDNLADVPLEEIFGRANERRAAAERTIVSVGKAFRDCEKAVGLRGSASSSSESSFTFGNSTNTTKKTTREPIASSPSGYSAPEAALGRAGGFVKRDSREIEAY
ncbi:hypothetical protein HIM_01022 [Hirsutella minnesotensis 3608]|nr:hypothetical protein HIM_01022 [Hirsutella minnesotensis 3608]